MGVAGGEGRGGEMSEGFAWFILSAVTASISVGSAGGLAWRITTLTVLLALRNAVMSGYIEGRGRYEEERKAVKGA